MGGGGGRSGQKTLVWMGDNHEWRPNARNVCTKTVRYLRPSNSYPANESLKCRIMRKPWWGEWNPDTHITPDSMGADFNPDWEFFLNMGQANQIPAPGAYRRSGRPGIGL